MKVRTDGSDDRHICGSSDRLTRQFCEARRDGNSALMNEVIAELLPELTNYLEKRLQKQELSRGIAEIAACETLLKALRFANQFDCTRKIEGWVRGISHNELMNIFRAKEMLRFLRLDRETGGTEESDNFIYRHGRHRKMAMPVDELVQREGSARYDRHRAALKTGIARLRPVERHVVERRIAGMPNREVAKELRISAQCAAVIFFKAKDELRRMIG